MLSIPLDLSQTQKQRKRMLLLSGLVAFILLLTVRPIWNPAGEIQDALVTVGSVLLAFAILGRCWCSLYIAGRKKTELVDLGPYSLCRNPLYLFNVMGAAGLGFVTGSIAMALLFCGITFLVFDHVIRQEETYLGQAFGPAFQRYCDRTPRWLPKRAVWKDEEDLLTRPRLLLITLRDSSCLFLFWPFAELINLAHTIGLLPSLILLP